MSGKYLMIKNGAAHKVQDKGNIIRLYVVHNIHHFTNITISQQQKPPITIDL